MILHTFVHSIKICIESNEKRSLKLALRCLESVCGFNNNAHKRTQSQCVNGRNQNSNGHCKLLVKTPAGPL
jgi:hypothetical protein